MTRCRCSVAIPFLCFAGVVASAGASEPYRTIGSVESNSDQVAADAKIEVIAEGMTWCEGPAWFAGDDEPYLLFSDIPRNSIYRWSESSGVRLFMQPSGYTGVDFYGLEPGSNGLFNHDGQLLMCEHGDRRISRLLDGGGKQTLVDSFEGRRLNSPNDLIVASDGTIYFTDPIYGLPKRENDPRRELDFCGVYRLKTDGSVQLITDQIERPNGIGLSTDERTLIVAQSNPAKPNWTLFSLGETVDPSGRVLADARVEMKSHEGLPDGLCVSSKDVIYASGPGGIYVMDFAGNQLGRFLTGKRTSNCVLDDDETMLYVTADDVVCRIRLTK